MVNNLSDPVVICWIYHRVFVELHEIVVNTSPLVTSFPSIRHCIADRLYSVVNYYHAFPNQASSKDPSAGNVGFLHVCMADLPDARGAPQNEGLSPFLDRLGFFFAVILVLQKQSSSLS